MKLYALQIGTTKVPYGQFYGGTEGWVGLRGMWRFLRDKRHFILVPIHVYLIDHPTAGLILVDAGINWDQAHAHHDYYRGLLARMAWTRTSTSSAEIRSSPPSSDASATNARTSPG